LFTPALPGLAEQSVANQPINMMLAQIKQHFAKRKARNKYVAAKIMIVEDDARVLKRKALVG